MRNTRASAFIVKIDDKLVHVRYSPEGQTFRMERKFYIIPDEPKVGYSLLITKNDSYLVENDRFLNSDKYKNRRKDEVFTINPKSEGGRQYIIAKPEWIKPLDIIAKPYAKQEELKEDPNIEKLGDYYIVISTPPAEDKAESPAPATETTDSYYEGGDELVKAHYKKERAAGLRQKKIKAVREQMGHLACEICGLAEGSSSPYPADCQERLFEVHHKTPLAKATEPVKTTLNDLALLCANCHRAVHTDPNVENNYLALQQHFTTPDSAKTLPLN